LVVCPNYEGSSPPAEGEKEEQSEKEGGVRNRPWDPLPEASFLATQVSRCAHWFLFPFSDSKRNQTKPCLTKTQNEKRKTKNEKRKAKNKNNNQGFYRSTSVTSTKTFKKKKCSFIQLRQLRTVT